MCIQNSPNLIISSCYVTKISFLVSIYMNILQFNFSNKVQNDKKNRIENTNTLFGDFMKIIVILSLAFYTFTYAKDFSATIDDVFCGEVDPFIVGDVCIVSLSQETGEKISIVMDIDNYYNQFNEFDLEEGLGVIVNQDSLELIDNTNILNILKQYDSDYFYVKATTLELKVLDESITSEKSMLEFIKKINGTFTPGNLPEKYQAFKVEKPRLTKNLITYFKAANHFKKKQWFDFIMGSEEYSNISNNRRIRIAENPEKELKVKYLLEIKNVYEIYRGSLFIGYFFEITDHVQAAIYQNQAWIEMFLDIEMNVLVATDKGA